MLRSMFSGISGLRTHQTMMDVTGNNIANVNTAGFKSSQTVFEDTLSQLLRAAGAPQAGTGGTNPAQVGLGARLSAISTNFSQGAAQTTGRSTDLMIQGDGFFVVNDGGESFYTRNGSFNFDAEGRLVSSSGGVVQGWTAVNGVIDPNALPGEIRLPAGTLLNPTATREAALAGNISAEAPVGTVLDSGITMYDAQGNQHDVKYRFEKLGANSWRLSISDGTTTSQSNLTFDSTGELTSATPATFDPAWGDPIAVDLSRVTQFGGKNSVAPQSQNGSPMGALQAFTIGSDGVLVGVFSNGLKQPMGQLALATFNNPPGLEKVAGSMYRNTVNSGEPQLGIAGGGGRGALASGTLEMSNVDLAQEFTNLIVAQRGFQANSRVISASDEILQDLVNLKR